MDVHWKLFATLREAAGTDEVTVEVTEEATFADALEALFTASPALEHRVLENGQVGDHIRAVHEGETVDDPEHADRSLSPGDELALFPPLSGG